MTNLSTAPITPVILSGGAGTRLWPLSRSAFPKQLLPLVSRDSLIQQTVRRVADSTLFASPLVVCNHEHRFLIAEQLRSCENAPAAMILEPEGRDSAPAAAVAAMMAQRENADALILLMPADHVIRDPAMFLDGVRAGVPSAAAGRLVTFGIRPTRAETGYGYIKAGEPFRAPGTAQVSDAGSTAWALTVEAFIEKPPLPTASVMVAEGGHYWNSGIFLFKASTFLEEVARFEPAVLKACDHALAQAVNDLDFLRLGPGFSASPAISVDYAVMERTDKAVVIPMDPGWSDVGSWSSLWDLNDKDADGNVFTGDVISVDSRNNLVRSEEMLTAVIGMEDVVVVVTDDAVLVSARDRVQDVKKVVQQLQEERRPEATLSSRVYRPWGYYQLVHTGERFQVKRITVHPGARLSLQKHYHRAEHWVVVNGTALVLRDGEELLVRENESVYLPLGTVHRLENPGKVPLNLIEVQSGAYLGEDDIVRFADDYDRDPSE